MIRTSRRFTVEALASIVDDAMGRTRADLVIKNVTLFNLATGDLYKTDIAMSNGIIVGTYGDYNGKREIDGTGLFAAPGFVDSHVHVESTLLTPQEFDRAVLPRGTTTAVCDPHEIANVLGEAGLKYFLDAADHTVMDLYVQLSSCVPATPLETSGGRIGVRTLKKFRDHPNTLGLAEFMNIGGVLGKDRKTLEKLMAFQGQHICGHMPGIQGKALNALAAVGIRNCHESTDIVQAEEKLAKGIHLLIREGTACKDLAPLHELITSLTSMRIALCTDDRKPHDIMAEGHIDHIVRSALAMGCDRLSVYRAASLSAATHFGLMDRGLIAPGFKADIVLLRDLDKCAIHSVVKDGAVVTEERFAARPTIAPVGHNSVHVKQVTADDFAVRAKSGEVDVIGVAEGSIVTSARKARLPRAEGFLKADPTQDVIKLAVLERHGKNGHIALGWAHGFGIQQGALASTVGHDSHNITVIGTNDADMALAVNHVAKMRGGFVAVKGGHVYADMPLPIAGLMSDKSFEDAARQSAFFNERVIEVLKPAFPNPVLTMAFLSLSVIPTLRLSDYGLTRFDPANGDMGPVLVEDQRRRRRARPPSRHL